MAISLINKDLRLSLGNTAVGKISLGNELVYSSGNVVTYHVDAGATYQEYIDDGASCLFPNSFTPEIAGYTFLGWRDDLKADGNVLTEKIMDGNTIELYAVFRKLITVTYYDNSTTYKTNTAYKYYNNGNVSNAKFTLTQENRSMWDPRGWSTDPAANPTINYSNGTSFETGENLTLYGCYIRTVTITFYDGSTTPRSKTGTAYYNSSGNAKNAEISLKNVALTGWLGYGWSTSSAAGAEATIGNGGYYRGAADATYYGLYKHTVNVAYNGNGSTSGSTAGQTGTRYYNSSGDIKSPEFTLNANGFTKTYCTFQKWALGSADGTQYAAGSKVTLEQNSTFYAIWIGTPYSITSGFDNYTWNFSQTSGDNNKTIASDSATLWLDRDGNTEYAKATLSASFATKGCNKVRVRVYSEQAALSTINGTLLNSDSVIHQWYYFDCSGDTFTLTINGIGQQSAIDSYVRIYAIEFYNG